MAKNSDKVNDNVARRRFITLAGSLLGVAGASSMLLSGSAEAAEKFPRDFHESITTYGTKVSKDKKELAAMRKELDKLLKSFRNGEDLEKCCKTLIDGRPELSRMMAPYVAGNDPPGFIIILILVIIIIVVSTEDLK